MSLCCKCLKLLDDNQKYGLHPICFENWFQCPTKAEFQGLVPHTSSEKPEAEPHRDSFFHGKFRKYTAELAGKKFVLKIVQADYPYLPRVEYVCNQIATFLKLRTPNYFMLRLEDQDCFANRNFMDGTRWQKLTHIYHYLPKSSRFDVETLGNLIFNVTHNPKDVELFYHMLLFDALVGNHDRHGRNLGILSRGKINRLSPIYDNPSYIGIESLLDADLNPCGKIFTFSSKKPSMRDYVIELKRLKADRSLALFRKRCSLDKILALIGSGILEEKVRTALSRLITKRYGEFRDAF